MRANYIIIPLIVLAIALAAGWLSGGGAGPMSAAGQEWYQALEKPLWAPDGGTVGFAWTLIYILTAGALLALWNLPLLNGETKEESGRFVWVLIIFVINAMFNVSWSFFFFVLHWLSVAALDAILLAVSTWILIWLVCPFSRIAAALLVPYALWVSFAATLASYIWLLNI